MNAPLQHRRVPGAEPTRAAEPMRVIRSSSPLAGALQVAQRAAGNQAVGALLRAGMLRAKLRVGSSHDPAEREADRVADAIAADGPERVIPVHARPSADTTEGDDLAGDREALLRQLGPGRPLDDAARTDFEARLGRDLDPVRIHDGPAADAAARSIQAKAFALGPTIAFRTGAFDTASAEGRHLLAHELTHVAQAAPAAPVVRRQTDGDGFGLTSQAPDFVVLSTGAPAFQLGEVKSIKSYGRAVRQLSQRSSASRTALALYDYDDVTEEGVAVYLQVFEPDAAGTYRITYDGLVGRVRPPEGVKPGTGPYGDAIEDPIRRLMEEVTGQGYDAKAPNAGGADLVASSYEGPTDAESESPVSGPPSTPESPWTEPVEPTESQSSASAPSISTTPAEPAGGVPEPPTIPPSAIPKPPAKAQPVPASPGAMGYIGAGLGILSVVAQYLELMAQYQEIGVAFARYRSRFFGKLGGPSRQYIYGSGANVTIFEPPNYATLEGYLARKASTPALFNQFLEEASLAGLDMRDGRWSFYLGDDKDDKPVFYDVNAVIEKARIAANAAAESSYADRRKAGTREVGFKSDVDPSDRHAYKVEASSLHDVLDPVGGDDSIPLDARFFVVGQIDARRGSILSVLSKPYYIVEPANRTAAALFDAPRALVRVDLVE
jgi:hypothetical protein